MRRISSTLAAAWLDFGTLFRYIAVGGASALVEFLVFNGLVYLVRLPLLPANLIASVCVITFGFLSHKHFTFRNQDGYSRQVRLYVAMLSVSLLLNNSLIYLFAVVFAWPPPLAKFFQLGVCFFWNYLCSHRIVFAADPPTVESR